MWSLERLAEFGEDVRFLSHGTGWRATVPLTLGELYALFCYRVEYLLLEFHLDQTIADFSPRIPLTLGGFGAKDLTLLCGVQRPSQVELCRERLARGHIGIAAHTQGTLAGYFWSCTQFDPALERMQLPLDAGAVYMADAFTIPAFRSNGVYTALLLESLRTLAQCECSRAVICVDASSPITPHACFGVGFREIGRFQYSRIAGRRRVRWLSTNHTAEIRSENSK